jgi:hypothetical protein
MPEWFFLLLDLVVSVALQARPYPLVAQAPCGIDLQLTRGVLDALMRVLIGGSWHREVLFHVKGHGSRSLFFCPCARALYGATKLT